MPIPDFGKQVVTYESGGYKTELECRYVAPGLTFHDLSRIFHVARGQAGPHDHLAGDPSKWPDERGIWAVTEAILKAIYET